VTAIVTNQDRDELSVKIDAGVKAAIAKALAEHRKSGRSIVIARDGQIVTLPPDQIPVAESTRPVTD
jgi:hypothetical protein